MSYEKDQSNGFNVRLDEQVTSGIYPELFSRQVPLWSTGENIQFTKVGVEKIKGNQEIFDTLTGEPVRGIIQWEDGVDAYVFAGTLTKIFQIDVINSTSVDVTNVAYNLLDNSGSSEWDGGLTEWDNGGSLWDNGILRATQWSMINYGSFMLATNGIDTPQIQKNRDAAFTDVGGLDVGTIEVFQKFGPHVLGFHTDVSDKEFVWCDADDVDTWVAAPDNLAGQLEIRELNTAIRAAVPLAGRIAVYGEDQMFLVSYLANDLVFGYQPALDGIGAVSKQAIVPMGRFNYGLSQQGFFQTDGSTFRYIDEPAMRTWFLKNVSQGQLAKTSGWHDEENSQIRWYFPKDTSDNDYCVSYNYEMNTWGFITGNFSTGQERRVAGQPIAGTETGKVVAAGVGTNDIGNTAITAFIRSKPMDMGDARVLKELDAIRIGYTGTSLRYKIGVSDTENGTVTWLVDKAVDKGFDVEHLRTAGRWITMEFYTNSLNQSWELQSIELQGRTEGSR